MLTKHVLLLLPPLEVDDKATRPREVIPRAATAPRVTPRVTPLAPRAETIGLPRPLLGEPLIPVGVPLVFTGVFTGVLSINNIKLQLETRFI